LISAAPYLARSIAGFGRKSARILGRICRIQVRALERTSDYLAAQQQAPANVVPLKKKTA
jgi:hypothetical protein